MADPSENGSCGSLAVPLLLVIYLVGRESGTQADHPFSVRRERDARSEFSGKEYEQRREHLQ